MTWGSRGDGALSSGIGARDGDDFWAVSGGSNNGTSSREDPMDCLYRRWQI